MAVLQHHLHPSTLFVHTEPHHVHTVLGSCVAVCLWDPEIQLGGINHYMLPTWNGTGLATPRYGNIAILKLIEAMEKIGASRNRLRAKIFGGAVVLNTHTENSTMRVGERNIETALSVLKDLSIPIVSQCVGGISGYKLIYQTYSGKVLLRRIQPTIPGSPPSQAEIISSTQTTKNTQA